MSDKFNLEKYELIQMITNLEETDIDVIRKIKKSIDFAYSDRTYYIADIQLDTVKNNGEIILKTGWTRGSVRDRFRDKRNGYVGVHKIHREYKLNAKLAECLNDYINNKFACKNSIYEFTGKTEMIDKDVYKVEQIIRACDKFIKYNSNKIKGRGRIN